MSDFFKRESWNHDNITTSARNVDDWDDLRGEDREGVEITLPPITREILVDQGYKPEAFEAEEWLIDNIGDHLAEDRLIGLAGRHSDGDRDNLIAWLASNDNYLVHLAEDEARSIQSALELAKEEHDEEALEEAKERFKQSDAFYCWMDGFEPAMNYYWPVELAHDVGPEEAAENIDKFAGSTALVWIKSADTYAIVLTGGGMDLSWDIAAAYVCCGCIPPSRLLMNLLRFAGGLGARGARFGKLVTDTLLPLLIQFYEGQIARAKEETQRLSEYLAEKSL